MSKQPEESFDLIGNIKAWLGSHNWVYWVLTFGGVAGLFAVLYFYFKRKESEKEGSEIKK